VCPLSRLGVDTDSIDLKKPVSDIFEYRLFLCFHQMIFGFYVIFPTKKTKVYKGIKAPTEI